MNRYLIIEELSTDNGKTWVEVNIEESFLSKAFALEEAKKLDKVYNGGSLQYRGRVI